LESDRGAFPQRHRPLRRTVLRQRRQQRAIPDYAAFDLGASYAVQARIPFNVFFNIDNVADRKYASSFSAATLAPGAPRSYRVGLQFDF